MSSSRQELPPFANENSTYVDWFSDTNTSPEPRILANGTDVAWPAGWTAAEALAWRVGNGLEPPTLV